MKTKVYDLGHARAGDKGNTSNVSVTAYDERAWNVLREQLTAEKVMHAYAEIARFIESSQHLLAENGIFAAMKGRYPDDEINAIPPGFGVRKTIELAVPGLEAERHLILIGRA